MALDRENSLRGGLLFTTFRHRDHCPSVPGGMGGFPGLRNGLRRSTRLIFPANATLPIIQATTWVSAQRQRPATARPKWWCWDRGKATVRRASTSSKPWRGTGPTLTRARAAVGTLRGSAPCLHSPPRPTWPATPRWAGRTAPSPTAGRGAAHCSPPAGRPLVGGSPKRRWKPKPDVGRAKIKSGGKPFRQELPLAALSLQRLSPKHRWARSLGLGAKPYSPARADLHPASQRYAAPMRSTASPVTRLCFRSSRAWLAASKGYS